MKKIVLQLLSFTIVLPHFLCAQRQAFMLFDGIAMKDRLVFVNGIHSRRDTTYSNYETLELNGKAVRTETLRDTFEVLLSDYGVKQNDSFHLVMYDYKTDLQLQNWNSFIHQQNAVAGSLSVSAQKQLVFVTTNEAGKFHYTVEQFRWNKWVSVLTFASKGNAGKNTYKLDISGCLFTGQNQFRIVAFCFTDKMLLSPTAELFTNLPEVTQVRSGDTITFSKRTLFELFTDRGFLLSRGADNHVILSGLRSGTYYLCFDNRIIEVNQP